MIKADIDKLSEARLQYRLALQCSLIEESLRAYGWHVHISDGYVGPEWIHYDTPVQAAGLPLIALESALTQRLNCVTRIKPQGEKLAVLVRRPRPPVDLLDLMQSYRRLISQRAGILGLAENGRLVQIDFNQEAHVLVAGNSASGKSSLLRTMATSIATTSTPEQVRLLLIQGSPAGGLAPLSYLPSAYLLQPVITNTSDAARSLCELATRVESLPDSRARTRIIVFIDRVEELLATGQLTTLVPLARLLMIGGSISIVLSTERPESDLIRYIGSHLSTRIVGQVANHFQASAATGLADSRAEQLPDRGAFLLIREKRVTYFQAAHADRYDLNFLMMLLRQDNPSSVYKSRPRLLTASQSAKYTTRSATVD